MTLDELTRHLHDSLLFIDTCSLMDAEIANVVDQLLKPALSAVGKRLIVATKVEEELHRHNTKKSAEPEDMKKRLAAANALTILDELERSALLDKRGDSGDQFPDGLFQQIFTQYRRKYKLTLITQDLSLTADILALNTSRSVSNIKPITVFRIWRGTPLTANLAEVLAKLEKRHLQKLNVSTVSNPRSSPVQVALTVSMNVGRNHKPQTPAMVAQTENLSSNRFKPYPSPTTIPKSAHHLLNAKCSIGSGVRFTTRLGQCELRDKRGSGGEGDIFSTNWATVFAKIYHLEKLTTARIEKLKLMCEHGIDRDQTEHSGICWPIDVLLDRDGIPRGYLMPEASGRPLGRCVFIRQELETLFPAWTRQHLVTLAVSILKKIQYLHSLNVIIGDINPNNILVKDEKTVFFVDTDSYQVGSHPCPVGTVHFTPPELQGVDFSTRLRTFHDEYFAIATLLFMILHAGKQPYAQIGGDSPAENVKSRSFPYRLGRTYSGKAPEGPWKYILSHLSFKVKKAFFETFDSTGAATARRTPANWIDDLESYAYGLAKVDVETGRHHMSRELFPTEFKPVSEYAKAKFKQS